MAFEPMENLLGDVVWVNADVELLDGVEGMKVYMLGPKVTLGWVPGVAEGTGDGGGGNGLGAFGAGIEKA